MNMRICSVTLRRQLQGIWPMALLAGAALLVQGSPPDPASHATWVKVTAYHGWSNALVMGNGVVEAVIVPAAGRILQFRYAGDTNGPFWENSKLAGGAAKPDSWNTEGSFGGDKAWPSPQSDWNWPPPSGFDGSPNTYSVSNGAVTLATPEDGAYKIRATRTVELAAGLPVMRVKTVFQRTAATSRSDKTLGVWVITQTREPVRVYLPVPAPSIFAQGCHQFGSDMPSGFRRNRDLISFTRDQGQAHKVGFDANSIAWIGEQLALRIDSPRLAGLAAGNYPDEGCNTEVYTNPGSVAPYVELECLGPVSLLPAGGRMEFVTTYTLFRRSETDPDIEARKILHLPPP